MALENTTAKYTVQIVQEGSTATAVADFKNLQAAAQQAAAVSANTFTTTAKGAEEAAAGMTKLAGASYYARSAIDSIRFAAADGGARAGFYAIDEAIRGLLASGISLGTLVPVIGGIAAAVGAGLYVWHEWNAGEREAAERAKELEEAFKGLVPMLKQMHDLQTAGLLTSAASAEYSDYITGRKKLYRGPNGELTPNATSQVYHPDTIVGGGQFGGGQVIPAGTDTINNPQASQTEIQKWVQDQMTAGGTIPKIQSEAMAKLSEQEHKASTEILSDVEKEKAAVHDRYEKQRQEMEETAAVALAKFGSVNFAQLPEGKNLNAALANTRTAESNDIGKIDSKENEAVQKSYEEYLREADALENQLNADAKREATEKRTALDQVITKQRELRQITNETTLANLTGEARQQEAIRQTTQAHIAKYQELANELGISEQDQQKQIALIQSGGQTEISSLNDRITHVKDWEQITASASDSFASGFSGAFEKFIEGGKNADQAFQQFAQHFLQQIGQMILQSLILKAIGTVGTATSPGAGLLGLFSTGGVSFAADGIMSVSSPTYFPKFNTVAGEAGMEMLTVLARPTFRNLGGMDAVVGSAGSSRLAITNADDLAGRGGTGGLLHIQIDHTPETQMRIVNQAVQGARIQVSQDLKRDTPISKGVRALST